MLKGHGQALFGAYFVAYGIGTWPRRITKKGPPPNNLSRACQHRLIGSLAHRTRHWRRLRQTPAINPASPAPAWQ